MSLINRITSFARSPEGRRATNFALSRGRGRGGRGRGGGTGLAGVSRLLNGRRR